MKKHILHFFAFSIGIFALNASAHSEVKASGNLLFAAKLDGAQSVPAVTTNANGIASVLLNRSMDTAIITATVQGLSGAITGIHIHEGAIGASGSVVTDLSSVLSGNTVRKVLTGSSLTKSWIAKLISGQLYMNVHTVLNAGGEIRGQLMLETDFSFSVWANGAEQVPAVTTNAYGMVVFNLSKDNTKLSFKGVFYGLSGAVTGIHLHRGLKGSNGGVVVDLDSNYNNGILMGSVNAAPILSDLMAGKLYINVHTAANAGGEVRGQLTMDKKIAFDAWMNGTEAGNTVKEVALASVKINSTLDSIWYWIGSNLDLSDTIVGLHFHHSGGIIDLDDGLNGNMAMGVVTGSDVNSTIISEFMSGTIYLAFHSKAYPAVKLKGDVMPLIREGYIMQLSGKEQVPAVSSNASGSGIVSISRDHTNAHIMVSYTNLPDPATGIHFHAGLKGTNGGVLKDLMPFHTANGKNGLIAGYWNQNSSPAFMHSDAMKFWKDSVYINIHTTANAGGEIRSQANRNFSSADNTQGIQSISATNLNIYPNPAENELIVTVNDEKVSLIQIFNGNGQLVCIDHNVNRINISQLNKGIYQVMVQTNRGTVTQSFIKN